MSGEYDVFKPLMRERSAEVLIATYGIAAPDVIGPVADYIGRGSRLLVGYHKSTHNMGMLRNVLTAWQERGVTSRLLPSCHLKLWIVGDRGYCGSCNLVPSTVINYMHPVKASDIKHVFETYWSEAHDPFRRGTNYLLLPQTRVRVYADSEEYTV